MPNFFYTDAIQSAVHVQSKSSTVIVNGKYILRQGIDFKKIAPKIVGAGWHNIFVPQTQIFAKKAYTFLRFFQFPLKSTNRQTP